MLIPNGRKWFPSWLEHDTTRTYVLGEEEIYFSLLPGHSLPCNIYTVYGIAKGGNKKRPGPPIGRQGLEEEEEEEEEEGEEEEMNGWMDEGKKEGPSDNRREREKARLSQKIEDDEEMKKKYLVAWAARRLCLFFSFIFCA